MAHKAELHLSPFCFDDEESRLVTGATQMLPACLEKITEGSSDDAKAAGKAISRGSRFSFESPAVV